jgi:predicted SprT family Zn-dependent metalloprotease
VYGFAASKFALFNIRTASNRRLSSAGGAFLNSYARLFNPQVNDRAVHDIKAYDQRLP